MNGNGILTEDEINFLKKNVPRYAGNKKRGEKNKSGILRVFKMTNRKGWKYQYQKGGNVKTFVSPTLKMLEEKVVASGYEWIIVDDEKARRSYEDDLYYCGK